MANELVNRPPHTVLGRRLWWLILGRAAGVVLLLLLGAIWKRSTLSTYLNSLRGIAQIIFTVAALSLIYCGAHLLWKNFVAQARIQFAADVLLVTWLVWSTGNVRSPYAALYIVLISIASLFVGPRGAMIASVGSATAFTACALAAINRFGPAASEASIADMIQAVGLADVSFLAVG